MVTLAKLTILGILSLVDCDQFKNVKVEFVSKNSYHLGEGPFWDQTEGVLYHVDTFTGDMCRLNVTNGRTERFSFGDYISIVIPIDRKRNRFVVSRRNQLLDFDWSTRRYSVLKGVGPEKFNDGKVDAKGRLWIGTLRNTDPPTNNGAITLGGGLYRLDRKGFVKVDKYTLPNGMAWSLDNKKFFVAETVERLIYGYDYDLRTGAISNKKIVLNFNNNPDFKPWEQPDGMAIDKEGKLWIAVLFGARIIRFNPSDGKVEGWVQTLANQTTSLAFGGRDYREMYVTTGWRFMTDTEREQNPNVGKVLRISGDVIRGPGDANRFKLV